MRFSVFLSNVTLDPGLTRPWTRFRFQNHTAVLLFFVFCFIYLPFEFAGDNVSWML